MKMRMRKGRRMGARRKRARKGVRLRLRMRLRMVWRIAGVICVAELSRGQTSARPLVLAAPLHAPCSRPPLGNMAVAWVP